MPEDTSEIPRTFTQDILYKYVTEEQKETIDNIKVDTLEKIVPEIAQSVRTQFNLEYTPARNSYLESRQSETLKKIIDDQPLLNAFNKLRLFTHHPENTQYGLVKSDDGEKFLSRMIKFPLSNVAILEIFNPPNSGGTDKMELRNYLIHDPKTGKTTDLLDLAAYPTERVIGEKTFVEGPELLRGKRRIKTTEIIVSNRSAREVPGPQQHVLTFIHEAGHSKQHSSIDTKAPKKKQLRFNGTYMLSRALVTFSLLGTYQNLRKPRHAISTKQTLDHHTSIERNAWAYALMAKRKYSEMGLEILPYIKNKQIINIANEALRGFDILFKTENAFSKQKAPYPNNS